MKSPRWSLAILAGLTTIAASEDSGSTAPREVAIHVLADGKAVPGATVHVEERLEFAPSGEPQPPPSFVTDVHGDIRVKLRGADALVLVIAKDLAPLQQVIKITERAPVELTLDAGIESRIHFVSSTNGLPFADAPVFFSSMAPVFSFRLLTPKDLPLLGRTDENGYFTWKHAPRTYALIGIPSLVRGHVIAFGWDCLKERKKEVSMRSE